MTDQDTTEYEEIEGAQCNRCGSEDVVWLPTKAGGWCLFNVRTDDVVSSMPHFKTCTGMWPTDYEMDN